ncbi:MAG: hypothetical protein U0359_38185 [Byssovorax sp.]
MIHFDRLPEPASFDEEVRKPGNAWLASHPDEKADKMPTLWGNCRKELADGFRRLCGYSAMWVRRGTVDHYLNKASPEGRPLAYEWDNYRFASEEVNQLKSTWNARILDPFTVEDGWFEIQLPSLQLVIVEDRIPRVYLEQARFTLKKLRLVDDDDVIESRAGWYDAFREGRITLVELMVRAPLLARAVRSRLDRISLAAFEDERSAYERFLDDELTLKGLRSAAPRVAAEIDDLFGKA